MKKVYECVDPECVRNDAFSEIIKIQKQLEESKDQKLLEKIRKIVREELKKETEEVEKIRVGDVRRNGNDVYVVTRTYISSYSANFCADLLYSSGRLFQGCIIETVKHDKLLAHYDTWIAAVNGEEFKNEI